MNGKRVAILTAVLTHLDPRSVERQLSYLRDLSPESAFVVCHGGSRCDFDALESPHAIFIEDPSLRGPHYDKSLNDTLRVIYEDRVRDDPAVEFVYLIEYDHLILRADFHLSLAALGAQSGAGLFAKSASPRNDTNWEHYLRSREDQSLNRLIADLSCRDDPDLRWGCLGTGLLLRREALSAFCALPDLPPFYVESFIPTLIYHLGFEIVDIDTLGDLYRAVRWVPEFSPAQAIAAKRLGRTFVHPFKRSDALGAIAASSGPLGSDS